jgi:hypothetical protein
MACNCAESRTAGVPNYLGVHDCEYVALRNSQIPAAEAFADEQAPRNTAEWTKVFIQKMDELVPKSSGPAILDGSDNEVAGEPIGAAATGSLIEAVPGASNE